MRYLRPVIILAALAGGMLVGVFATRHGIGVSPDSMVYIAGARNLAEGRGFSLPPGDASTSAITHHAPLYSAVLAGFGLLGIDPMAAARGVNAALFFANLGLVGMLIFNATSSMLAVLVGVLYLLASPVMFEVHSMAWSESLFIFCSLLTGYALDRALKGHRFFWWLAALATGAGFLTRYAGAALIPAGALILFLFGTGRFWKRVLNAAGFGLVSVVPGLLWSVRNYLLADTATSREVSFHPPSLNQLLDGLNTVSGWLQAPAGLPAAVKILPVAFLTIVVVVHLLREYRPGKDRPHPFRMAAIFVIFILAYGGFLLVSLTLFDANTPLDNRILSPILVWSVTVVMIAVARLVPSIQVNRLVKSTGVAIAALFILVLSGHSAAYVRDAYRTGLGFNSVQWAQSDTLAAVKGQPVDVMIYSNAPEAVYFQSGHPARRMPSSYQSANRRDNPDYAAEMDALAAEVQQGAAMIVWLDAFGRPTLASEDDLVRRYQLDPVQVFTDGKFYAAATK